MKTEKNNFLGYQINKIDNGQIEGQLKNLDQNQIGPGNLLVEAKYSSVNYKDALAATGKGKILKKFPLIGGIDVAGRVISCENPCFKKNDLVIITGQGLGENHPGGYSQKVCVPHTWACALPEHLSLKDSMIIGTAGFTAALALYRMERNSIINLKNEGPIIVNGASGGVGSLATHLFASQGYEVWAVTGRSQFGEYLKSLGAAKVISEKELELGQRPLEKAKFVGAVDNLGGNSLTSLLRHLKPWANLASIGLVQNHNFTSSVMPFILRGNSILGISSTNCPSDLRLKLWHKLSKEWKLPLLSTILDKEIGLKDLKSNFTKMLHRKTQGRILVNCQI